MIEWSATYVREHVAHLPFPPVQQLARLLNKRNVAYTIIFRRNDVPRPITSGMPDRHGHVLPINRIPLKTFQFPLSHTRTECHKYHLPNGPIRGRQEQLTLVK